jgi:hypothetical protein
MRTASITIQFRGDSTSEPPAFFLGNPPDYPQYSIHSGSSGSADKTVAESQVVRTTFSTVRDIRQWELSQHYRELGAALNELTTLEEDDDWRINASVYNAASYMATELRIGLMPPPQIFVHGPTLSLIGQAGSIIFISLLGQTTFPHCYPQRNEFCGG